MIENVLLSSNSYSRIGSRSRLQNGRGGAKAAADELLFVLERTSEERDSKAAKLEIDESVLLLGKQDVGNTIPDTRSSQSRLLLPRLWCGLKNCDWAGFSRAAEDE